MREGCPPYNKEQKMDASKEYIKMCSCLEIQLQEFAHMPNFHFAYNFNGIWHIHHDVLGGEDDKKVWLPRQDQIQEMMNSYPMLFFLRMLYLKFKPGFEPSSWEQLWLAFYMYDKHKKKWDGEKWKQ